MIAKAYIGSVFTDHLKSLHTAAIDAKNGYVEALDDAAGNGMTGLFKEMIDLHSAHADELKCALQKLGEEIDDNGAFMTAVHRTIFSIRSLFNGLGKSVLPGLIDGEERNASHYGEALNIPGVPDDVRMILIAERAHINSAIAKMRVAERS